MSETPQGPNTTLLARLAETALFADVDRRSLAEIAGRMDEEHLERGQVLFHQNDTDGALFVVLEGRLEAYRRDESGRRSALGTIEQGEPAGEIQVLTGGKRTASVRAVEATRVARLPGDEADWLADNQPAVMRQLLEVIQRRLRYNRMVSLAAEVFDLRDAAALRDFEQRVEWKHLAGGEALFRQGEPGDCLYLVVSGLLKIVFESEREGPRVINEIGRGEMVGEIAVIADEPRAASAWAIRDSELIRVDRDLFEHLAQRDARVLMQITRRVVRRLRRTLHPERRKTGLNIALVPCSPDVPLGEVAAGLAAALAEHGSTLSLSAERLDELLANEGTARVPPQDPRSLRLSSWLEEQETEHRFLVLEADREDTPWTRRCLQQARRILLVANAGEVTPPSAAEQALPSTTDSWTDARRILVLLHPEDAPQPSGTRRWLESRDPAEHYHVRRGRQADYARLARFLAGRAVGLVLGGGGARGFAHFGVFLALREAGVPIDMIGGTSMGAVIGAQCALGWDRETMVERNRSGLIRKKPFQQYTLPLLSLVSSRRLDGVLQEAMGDTRVEDLWLRFFCVSSNLSRNSVKIHDSGLLWQALRASSALPGIVLPVVSPEGLLVDGGLVNNLPGDVMRQFCRTVIVVDVSSGQEIQGEYRRLPSPWQVALARLTPFRKELRVPTILDVLMGSTMLSSAARAQQVTAEADLFLKPPIGEFGMLQFTALEELIDIGHRDATKEIARWLKERPDPWLSDAR